MRLRAWASKRRATTLAIFTMGCLAGCGAPVSGAVPAASGDRVAGTLTVLAAASLTEAFTEIAHRFEQRYPGVHVATGYGASSTLAAQVQQGAEADVLVTADQASMARVEGAGLLAAPARVFAHNKLEIAVAPGNPKHIASLADLAGPGLLVTRCAPGVPCGLYAQRALDKAGVRLTGGGQEVDVKSVLSRVELGEADAGIVYRTDVFAARGRVAGVPIPDAQNVVADYPIAMLARGQRHLGEKFVEFVTSAAGLEVLAGLRFTV